MVLRRGEITEIAWVQGKKQQPLTLSQLSDLATRTLILGRVG